MPLSTSSLSLLALGATAVNGLDFSHIDVSNEPPSIKLEGAMCPASNSCHVLYEGGSHYNTYWEVAAALAEKAPGTDCPMPCATDEVLKPYLVAINSQGEQDCINALMSGVKEKYCAPGNVQYVDTCEARPWIGGAQFTHFNEPAGDFQWHSGEDYYHGNCDKTTCGTNKAQWKADMVYENFVQGEPNNGDKKKEHYLELRFDSSPQWQWNDRSKDDFNPPGNALYIVEFKCFKSPSTEGDPHFSTWAGEKYDYHGKCDLELMSDPNFNNGQGLAIHIRSERVENWSYVKNAAIRIGEDVFEIEGSEDPNENPYWINGVYQGELSTIGGFEIKYKPWGEKRRRFIIYLGNGSRIMLGAYLEWARVSLYKPTKELFGETVGLFGNYTTGRKLARDGYTVLEDYNEFGQEWQVQPDAPKLFHELKGPQAPFQKCVLPEAPKMRRRLAEQTVTLEQADEACSRHGIYAAEHDDCVKDVMALDNLEVSEGYMVDEGDEEDEEDKVASAF